MQLDNDTYFALVESQLREGLTVRLNLRGTSMQSALRDGDTIDLAPLGTTAPQVGDVVLFRYGGRHLLHRVVRIEGEHYTLRGDNCIHSEHCRLDDIVGILSAWGGQPTGSAQWRRRSRRSLWRGSLKRWTSRWLGRDGRRKLRPYYFALLALLMWAPLNGFGIPLDNYMLGIRADHLLHASVYLPCALFVLDLASRKWGLTWLISVSIGLLTEGVQYLLPYRGFDINDLVANAIGVTIGWLAIYYFLRTKKSM